VRLDTLFYAAAPARFLGSSVTFESGARLHGEAVRSFSDLAVKNQKEDGISPVLAAWTMLSAAR
jgi:hypothetical protein